MLKLLLIIAAVPLYWERTPNRPAPAQFDTFHGESLDFRCTFNGFGALPFAEGADVRLWYQTNGMGTAWWSITATLSNNVLAATFTPSADPGAERLTIFFGAPSNAYAAAQVRFRDSPGATPNHLDPPSVLDWQAELAAATNGVMRSLAGFGLTTNDICAIVTNVVQWSVAKSDVQGRLRDLGFGEAAEVTRVTPSHSQEADLDIYFKSITNHGEIYEGDLSLIITNGATYPASREYAGLVIWDASDYGTAVIVRDRNALGLARLEDLPSTMTSNDICSIVTNVTPAHYTPWSFSPAASEGFWYYMLFDEYNGETYWLLLRLPSSVTPEEAAGFNGGNEPSWSNYVRDEYSGATRLDTFVHFMHMGTGITATRTRTKERNALGLARLKDIPTNHVTHAELNEAIESIPEVDTSNLATKAELTPIQSSVNSMWATLYGENVWIAITNHMRQIQGTVPSLRLWEVRDSQTNMVYSSAEEIEHVVTQKVNAAKSEIKGMIPRTAWGSYQSSGEENPSSNAVTVVNSSKIMLTGGGEWYRTIETGGASVWVLKTNGLLSLGGDTNGFFRVCDAEGNAQIEVVKTADQVVGAFASDHDFDGDGNFTVTFNASGSEHPKASCAVDLGDDFEEEDDSGNINSLGITVEWMKNGGGMWVATIHQDTFADRLFVYGKKKVAGENLVRNNAPTALDGGIYINGTKYRIVPYSTGGKTYMTLEAWQ